jgi:hypothetical protein
MADNKIRNKLRKNRMSIDQTHMGPEPVFQKGETLNNPKRDSLWTGAATWYNYYLKPKDYVQSVLSMAENQYGYDKEKIKHLKKLKDWELTMEIGKIAKIFTRGYEYTNPELKRWGVILDKIYQRALVTVEEIKEKDADKPAQPSIQERQKSQILDTVWEDWDSVVDGWMDGDFKQSFDAYKLFKTYQLKGATLNMFKDMIMNEYQPIKDAYDGTCDQAVEAYSHVTKRNQKKMITLMETIFEDLDKLKVANKAAKIPRAKKPKASDVQIKNLKYKVEDIDAKISSINPVMIPGREVLFVFNTKTRKLMQLNTNSTKGFEVSGTTVKNVCDKSSKQTTLRKPEDIIPLILSKSTKQIDKLVWDTITTKVSVPNGRINADCVLLRAL